MKKTWRDDLHKTFNKPPKNSTRGEKKRIGKDYVTDAVTVTSRISIDEEKTNKNYVECVDGGRFFFFFSFVNIHTRSVRFV